MPMPEPELERLLDLSLADRDHPDYILYAGLPAFNHDAVLAVLSSDRLEAKRLHRMYMWMGVISPTTTTSNRIADALKVGQGR